MDTASDPTYVADHRVRVIRSALADGRELLYFDDPGTSLPATRAADTRALGERPPTAAMRYDALSGDWVSVATARQSRVHLPPAALDPLAPQSPNNPSEIPSNYDVAVFENRSPSFGPALLDNTVAPPELDATAGVAMPAGGRCEVVCFSPESEGSLGALGINRIRTVIEAWAQRTHELSALAGVAQVFPFENRGEAIGVTLHHPHGQIYAYPFVTPRTATVLAQLDRHGASLFADVVDAEASGPRVLARTQHWIAFVPFAARWPVQVTVLPTRHITLLSHTTLAERDELASMLKRLLAGVDGLYGDPTPYILGWHQAPRGRDDVRLMLTLTSPRRAADRLKFLAGSEAAMGAWVADIDPESAAARLRDAIAAATPEAAP